MKTQFDFESTLESCLLKSSSIEDVQVTAEDKNKVKHLNRYKFKDDFVQYYNIELPEEYDLNDALDFPGIGVFTTLKVLMLEHIPRIIRIPEGEYRWYDSRCQFSGHVVGFRKFPLNKKCLEQLPSNLTNCQWPNFQVSNSDLRVLETQGFCGVPESDTEIIGSGSSISPRGSGYGAPKVRVEPSMLRFAPFKAKSE